MNNGDYVMNRRTKTRGFILGPSPTNEGWVSIYSPQLSAFDQLWESREDELTRLLRKDES